MIKKAEKSRCTAFAILSFFVNFVTENQQELFLIKSRKTMSKTIEMQIEKSRNLIGGLRKHVSEQGERGVSSQEIEAMEQALQQLEQANAECDRLREELSPKVKRMNEVLQSVKAAYAETKKTLKGYYPQERWADYGVPDKR